LELELAFKKGRDEIGAVQDVEGSLLVPGCNLFSCSVACSI